MADGKIDVYRNQGFDRRLRPVGRIGLLIVDFVNGFADPAIFGGGNIAQAIAATRSVLDHARAEGKAPKIGINRESESPAHRPEPSHGPER